jgi:hypothetical protein
LSSPQEEWHPVRLAAGVFAGVLSAALIAVGVWVWHGRSSDDLPRGVAGLVGGCERFTVFAQNRWDPRGAAVRAQPYRESNQVGNYDPNQLIPVNGWVRTRPAYPANTAPWNSDVWFHVADNSGWVAFAGVRADPTDYDPTGRATDGGRPAPRDPECSGSIR